MKFVYHSANKEDLKDLYKRVLNAGLKLPLKPLDATHVSSKLLRPLAVYDYTRYHDPKKVYWPSIEEKGPKCQVILEIFCNSGKPST